MGLTRSNHIVTVRREGNVYRATCLKCGWTEKAATQGAAHERASRHEARPERG